MRIYGHKTGMGLLSIILALAIISFLYFIASRKNMDTTSTHGSYLKQTGLDASNYKSTLDSSKRVLDAAVSTKSKQAEGF